MLVITMIRFRTAIVFSRRMFSSHQSKREMFEENIGPLVHRVPDEDWLKEAETFEAKNIITKPNNSYKRFIHETALDWGRINDREAGEDEGITGDSFVKDTKLVKAKSSVGFAAVKTAGIDTIIDILKNNSNTKDINLLEDIVSRTEYLGPTLSVKNIRSVLERLAKVTNMREVSQESIEAMMQTLGEELLCRFHSMTLFSCTSIAESMAAITFAKHEGVLNIISLAFKQNMDEPIDSLNDEQILDMSVRLLKAYASLDHLLPIVVESVLKTATERRGSLSVGQQIDILTTLIPSHVESLHSMGSSLIPTSTKEIQGMSAAQCERLFQAGQDSVDPVIKQLTQCIAKRNSA
jgi:hypothetical protein